MVFPVRSSAHRFLTVAHARVTHSISIPVKKIDHHAAALSETPMNRLQALSALTRESEA